MNIYQNLGALVLVLGLMLGLAWALKKFGITRTLTGNHFIKTLAVMSLGAREKIALVEVGETWLVLGITPHAINTLHSMPKGSMELPGNLATAQTFASLLERVKKPQAS
ncbi:MAG: flagellar biosynthetic protein FliO [Burkholderiales bacterium]|jgi:flagellar protein FliO/FliZ|nr:flagellar biosynthetic protein FliO [Burkholderiales bacterium]